ncbi:hypothetical protein GCM10020229_48330 [Kitasatospora albolonga]
MCGGLERRLAGQGNRAGAIYPAQKDCSTNREAETAAHGQQLTFLIIPPRVGGGQCTTGRLNPRECVGIVARFILGLVSVLPVCPAELGAVPKPLKVAGFGADPGSYTHILHGATRPSGTACPSSQQSPISRS